MSGMHSWKPMRYESVNPVDAERFLDDDRWIAEQKIDGQRCMVKVADGNVQLYASPGTVMARTSAIDWRPIDQAFAPLAASGGEWVLDGELMADGTLWLFDAPLTPHTTPRSPFSLRRVALVTLADVLDWNGKVRVIPQAVSTREKHELWRWVLDTQKEGIVLKRLDASYRTSPGGRTKDVLKVKRTYTVDCVVTATGIDGKDSSELSLYDSSGFLVPVGRTTMKQSDARCGDVVEVRFLYVLDPKSPRLYQSVFLRRRDDKPEEACTLDQLDHAFADRDVLYPIGAA